jgi:hypothetical protein
LTLSSKKSRSTRRGSRSNKAVTAASPQIRNSCRACGGRLSPSLIAKAPNAIPSSRYPEMNKMT